MKRRIMAVLLSLVAALTGVVVIESPASAAAYCGSACNGQNPATYVYAGRHCADDASTIDTIWHGPEYLELRYSAYCQTIWIRSNAYQSPDNVIGGVLQVYPYGDFGNLLHKAYLPQGNGTRWSVMFDDHGVCGLGQLYAGGSAYDFTVCY
jgi:hypothetical protein